MNADRNVRLFVVCLLILLGNQFSFAQSTINVPADQSTIQNGINAARDGDTVLVAPGTYFENINFSGKNITVKSSGGRDVTTIDGGNHAPVVTFSSHETNAAVLDGFTLTHGLDNINHDGGGVFISFSSPTIQQNIITANGGTAGLGIYSYQSSPVIQFNNIHHNIQSFGSGGGGGGISLLGGNAKVINNTIANNSITGGGTGGGITINNGGHFISGNSITANYAVNGGGGIALINDSTALIVNNLVTNNTVGNGAIGIGIDDGLSISTPSGNRGAYLFNNTLVNNGLYIVGFFSHMLIENNISYTTGTKKPIHCSGTYSNQLPVISNNDFFSTTGTANGGICASIAGTNGNISNDPLFVNPAGDWQLSASSPAIDSGNNSAPGLPTTDFSGSPRIADGNADGTEVVDMGAFETVAAPTPATATFTPGSYAFPDQNIGTQSASQTFILTNSGSVPAHLSQLAFTGDFTGNSSCPASLAAGASCSVSISFQPNAMGPITGTATYTGNFSSTPPQINLSGTGLAAVASLSASFLNFGNVYIGSASSPQTATLTNMGNAALQISGVNLPAGFHQTNDCGSSLEPSATCTLSITFAPTGPGTATGNLTVLSNALGGPVSVELVGNGQVVPTVQLAPSSLDFGNVALGSSATQRITLKLNGDGIVYIGAITVVGGGFTLTHNCGTLSSGGTCNIDVTFAPTALGAVLGSVQVTSNRGLQFASVSGFGSGAGLSITPRNLDFGSWWVGYSPGPYSFNGYNPGDQPLTYTLSLTPGDFSMDSSLCPNPLPAGAWCALTIRFLPTTPGLRTASLTFVDNAADTPQVIALRGTGLDYSLSISPSTVYLESGKSATFVVSAADLGGNFGLQINLACSTNAPATRCTLAQPFMGTGQSVSFVVTTVTAQGPNKGTQPGTYQVAIHGASGATNHSASAALVVRK